MKEKKKWKKTRTFMKVAFGFLLLFFAIGFTYQGISVSREKKTNTAVGELHEVYGNNMHIYKGGEGDSTVVFLSGWGTANPYVDFYPLYEKLEKDTKYAVVDRFGYGYSEMTDRKREIDNIVEETRVLLQKSGLEAPYILVGHSLASLETLRYAQKYPEEVAGIVLLDAGNPEFYAKQKPATWFSQVTHFLRTSGVLRMLLAINDELLNGTRNNLEFVPAQLQEIDRRSNLSLIGNKNVTDEMRQIQNNTAKVLEQKSVNAPLTVLTADSFGEIKADWLESQKALSTWSPSGKHIVLEDANHSVHQYQPDLIANEILSLIKQ
ncbi:alpha/beta fold hydrolase [Bacillus sp. Marseille-P3661]|uniref:alpha/beta fold hydrolase n=1 Tax=Bacillus sp. Marseille-P3661 TaxID=1936234 RepID=UPI0015E19E1F|nr:alpha/beta hydrolase [Bacillus sp. Marseille-P3661]